MTLPYDPGDGRKFWSAIRKITGFPEGAPDRLIGPMLFESDALHKLPSVLRRIGADPAQPLQLITDSTPMRRGKDSLKPLVRRVLQKEGWKPETTVLKPDSSGHVRADQERISAVETRLRPKAAVISIGSGTVTDIAKHACHNFEKKNGCRLAYAAYPTANSVGAYTSNVAAVYVNGVKRSLDSRLPDAVVYDLETLRDAPYAMTVAGAGEMLVCFTSFPDWLIAHRLGMDSSYTEFQHTLIEPFRAVFISNPAGLRERTLEAMAVEAKFMAVAALGGSLIHASTHLSGYEHVMSHLIDQQSELSGRPPALHGTQVVLASMLVSEAYRLFLAAFNPADVRFDRCYPVESDMKKRIEAAFAVLDPSGRTAAECWGEYRVKLERWHSNRQVFRGFLENWQEIRGGIERFLRPPEHIASILVELGSPLSFDELDPPVDEALVKFAFLNAPLIRRRATLGDLLVFLDWDRVALWENVWRGTKAVAEAARKTLFYKIGNKHQ